MDAKGIEVLDIDSFLKGLAGEPIFYAPNPGNAGDSLIAVATFQLFRKHGLDVHLPPLDFDSSAKVVIFGGGGNLLPPYTDARDFIARHHRRARRLIVLPHSVVGNEDLLASLGRNVTIICREAVSFAHVTAHAPNAEVLLAHDLVLSLNVNDALHNRPALLGNTAGKALALLSGHRERSRDFVSPKYFLRDWRFLARFDLDRLIHGRPARLNAFRTDAEQRGTTPAGNYDLSRQFEYGCHSERVASYAAFRFLSAIDRFTEVHTNRLHVCIGAALLGKTVSLYSNSYYKCEAVYRFSLENRFTNVTWIGA